MQLRNVETEENVKEDFIGKNFQRRYLIDIIEIHVWKSREGCDGGLF
jgi:hypothetical protein